jgi:cell wall-associated NlpC family hydrolase
MRTSLLAPTTVLLGGALSLSLLAAAPAQAAPVAPVAPAESTTAVVAGTTSSAPTSKSALAAKKAKAKLAKKKKYQRNVRDKIVRIAKRKLHNSQYVAGAAGPRQFDCSGFTQFVWKKAAGKYLPHYSKSQAAVTKNVSRGKLKRGDLLFFFGSGAHHVSIYVGHGKMIGAANPSADLERDSVFAGWYGQRYSGAGRLFKPL